MQIKNLKAQLQTMIGEEPTGDLTLLALPKATDEMLDGLDYDAGAASGLASNMDLYWKNEDISDAKDDWDDASYGYARTMAEHTYQSKVYAYEAAKQSVMFSYGNLYRAVSDNRQILEAAQVSLSYEQKNCAAMEKKLELGMISENAFQDAQDALASAEDAVTKAETDLYSSYLSYEWATRGIIAG
jgi:outer membrane protein TolC